ncbi:hypothetical protein H4R35_004723 [Dimargaris xerosporica]|nr:hypothetical protein H4R35_004723 [Dimargaris xerosporica]
MSADDSHRSLSRDRYSRDRRSRSPAARDGYRRMRSPSPSRSRSPRREHGGSDGDRYVPNYTREGYTPAPRFPGRRSPELGARGDSYSPMDAAGGDIYGRMGGRAGLVDPDKLDHLVPIKYFTDYHRSRSSRSISPDEIDEKYDAYKVRFRRRLHKGFFSVHKDDDWFRERYEPTAHTRLLTRLKQQKIMRYQAFAEALTSGQLDDLDLDAPLDLAEGGEGLEVDTSVETFALVIRSIPPSITREQLEQLCSAVPGYEYVGLAEPNPMKKFHRFGWVKFVPGTDMDQALHALDSAKIDEFQFHFGRHTRVATRRVAADVFGNPDHMVQDIDRTRRLIQLLDDEMNQLEVATDVPHHDTVFKGQALVDERVALAMDSEPEVGNSGALSSRTKKVLDLQIMYLRRVHCYCYYCAAECECPEGLQRKCGPDLHYRPRPVSDKSPQRGSGAHRPRLGYWQERLDGRLDPPTGRDLERMGGKNLDDEFEATAVQHIEKVEEGKYRCRLCSKLFKGENFVVKHIRNKHSDAADLATLEHDVAYFNNFVRDSRRFSPTNPHHSLVPGGGSNGGGPLGNNGPSPISARLGPSMMMGNPMLMNPMGMPMGPSRMPPAAGGMMGNGMFMGGGFPMSIGAGGGWNQFGRLGMMNGGGYRGPRMGGGVGPMSTPPADTMRDPPPGVRPDPRQVRSYVDLDAPAEGDMDNDSYL